MSTEWRKSNSTMQYHGVNIGARGAVLGSTTPAGFTGYRHVYRQLCYFQRDKTFLFVMLGKVRFSNDWMAYIDIEFPPRGPDLTLMDIFTYGMVKVYASKPLNGWRSKNLR